MEENQEINMKELFTDNKMLLIMRNQDVCLPHNILIEYIPRYDIRFLIREGRDVKLEIRMRLDFLREFISEINDLLGREG